MDKDVEGLGRYKSNDHSILMNPKTNDFNQVGNDYDSVLLHSLRYKDNVAPGHYTGQAISSCKKKSGQECYLFASRNTIVWDNGTPYKKRRLKRKDIKAGKTFYSR